MTHDPEMRKEVKERLNEICNFATSDSDQGRMLCLRGGAGAAVSQSVFFFFFFNYSNRKKSL